ncbi:alpha/beta hydrolase [Streptomyces sp. NBC_00659]|uniref:alpha/beta hydrolase n=1 Tax=Streptomyces sp. NBC_00659 TaxID=2903669 RepID=UPI002E32C988|nr:alpha/beta fold hydrolase [Streptomyces sp. NBC_00659]
MNEPAGSDLPVEGGTLRVLRFGRGPRIALAAHGITGSGMSFRAMARHLPDEWSLFAPDLRGRGGSADTPGPYGLDRHAMDLCRLAQDVGGGRPVALTGHSMGAYTALRAAALRPALFDRLLLVDGGLPLPVPPGTDLDAVLDTTLGPALARLGRTYETDAAYVDFFRAHPALGPHWNADIETYVRYDVTGPRGARRSKVREEAVRHDGRDLLTSADLFAAGLTGLGVPVLLLHASLGLLGQEPPMLEASVVARWTGGPVNLPAELVEGSNHYTILLGTAARTVAERFVALGG